MGRFRVGDWVRTTVWDRNVDPGLAKYVYIIYNISYTSYLLYIYIT